MAFERINGIAVHHRLSGRQNPAIVFINSLGTDFRIWDSVVEEFEDEFRLLVYDKRGHGLTELGDAPPRMETYAADLAGLMEHCGIDGAILCGLSIGGLIAQALYATRPDLVHALVFCDTAHKIGTAEMWNGRIAAATGPGIDTLADGVMEKWFTPAFHRERAAELAGYRTMLERQSPAGYAMACAALRDADFTRTAQSIGVPSLVVVGDQDGSTPPELVESFARLVPGAGFEIIADAAHIPCVERPRELAALIRRFAATLQKSGT